MEHIDPETLGELPSRINYLREFIGFTVEDSKALRAAAPVVSPLVPAAVEAVYDKLLSFDITAQAFVPRQTGYDGVAPTALQELSQDHPMIRFRKDFLAGYLAKIVSLDFESLASWQYLDKVGMMHTGRAGFAHRSVSPSFLPFPVSVRRQANGNRAKKPALRVEYMHCAILLGLVEDILVDVVVGHLALDLPTKTAVARAVNKVPPPRGLILAKRVATNVEGVCSCCGSRMTSLHGTILLMPRLTPQQRRTALWCTGLWLLRLPWGW